MDKAVKQFAASLQELANGNNTVISILTSLAEDYVSFAVEIVTLVEDYITKVEPFSKVLTIQLIDSIVKNVGGTYVYLFGRNIAPTFCRVYYEADTECQFSMIRLRKTWGGIFSSEVLRYIDSRVREPELILIPIRLSTKRRHADDRMECGNDSKYDKIYESRNIVKRYRPLPTDESFSQSNKMPRIDHTIGNGDVSNDAENMQMARTFSATTISSINRTTSEVNERIKNLTIYSLFHEFTLRIDHLLGSLISLNEIIISVEVNWPSIPYRDTSSDDKMSICLNHFRHFGRN